MQGLPHEPVREEQGCCSLALLVLHGPPVPREEGQRSDRLHQPGPARRLPPPGSVLQLPLAALRQRSPLPPLCCLPPDRGRSARCAQIYEKSPSKVKNFGIWFRYESRTGTHNAYKEFRDLTLTGAINTMYQDMAGRSRAKAVAIQILKTAELKASECKRPNITQLFSNSLKFPIPHRVAKTPKEFKTTCAAAAAALHHHPPPRALCAACSPTDRAALRPMPLAGSRRRARRPSADPAALLLSVACMWVLECVGSSRTRSCGCAIAL